MMSDCCVTAQMCEKRRIRLALSRKRPLRLQRITQTFNVMLMSVSIFRVQDNLLGRQPGYNKDM